MDYRKYLNLKEEELKRKVLELSREEIINWLCWNDRNGIYRDEDSQAEFGNIMSMEEGREIMLRQILE